MKKDADKRIRVYLESFGESVNYERLFRALSLILSEEDLMKYLLANRNIIRYSGFEECRGESEVLENIAKF